MVLPGGGHGVEDQRAVQGVALSPEGAVEDHRGEEQKEQIGRQGGGTIFPAGQSPDQPQTAPGQNPVKQDGKKLDGIEIREGEIGDGGHEVEIGRVVVAHRLFDRGKAAVLPEKGGPLGEKVPVVVGDMIQTHRPQQRRQRQDQKGQGQFISPIPRPAEGEKGQPGPQEQTETGDPSDGRSAQCQGRAAPEHSGQQERAQEPGEKKLCPRRGRGDFRHNITSKTEKSPEFLRTLQI